MNIGLILLTIFILSVIGSLFHYLILQRKRNRIRRARFEGREILSKEEVLDQFFSGKGLDREMVWEVWSDVADIHNLKPGLLRPDDRFDKEFAPVGNDPVQDDELDCLGIEYADLADELGLGNFRIRDFNTLGQMVEFFGRKTCE